MSKFTRATRSQRKVHAAIDGPSGSGKTFTALRLAFSLVDAGMATRVAVIDTEHNSASLYATEAPDGRAWDFDTLNLKKFGPDQFSDAINEAVKEKYDAIVIDSLSHAWMGEGGALDIVDNKGGNKFTAWKDVTPMHRRMIDTIIRCPAHIIATMRSKTEYVLEDNEKGQKVPRKIGVAPVQRDGMEYEFDLYASMDWSHQIKVSKSRCPRMQDVTTVKPGPGFWAPLFEWLNTASPMVPQAETEAASSPAATASVNGNGKPHGDIYSELIGKADAASDIDALRSVAGEANDAAKNEKLTPEQVEQFKVKIGERKTALSKSS
jgi:hypothetical protein